MALKSNDINDLNRGMIIESTAIVGQAGQVVLNPDGTNIGDALPTTGNNPSFTITEAIVGTVTTTTIEKVINAVTYTKTIVEDTSTGITTITSYT